MQKRNLGLCQTEIQTSVNLTAFMTGVTIFFTGLVLANYSSYDSSVRIPILFLIISTFGFLYSTLILGNAAGQLARLNSNKFERFIWVGDYISEYLGVYLLVLSIPLVINVITPDLFLRVATVVVALCGLILYHLGGFSIMERNFKKKHYLFLAVIVILEILSFYTQAYLRGYFIYASLALLVFILLLTFFAKREE
jgi:hypothetical protein